MTDLLVPWDMVTRVFIEYAYDTTLWIWAWMVVIM